MVAIKKFLNFYPFTVLPKCQAPIKYININIINYLGVSGYKDSYFGNSLAALAEKLTK